MVNGAFHNGSYFIKSIPFLGISLDTWEHAKIHIFISIGCSSLFCSTAGLFAVANPFAFYHIHFGTAPFGAVSTSFFSCDAKVFHGKRGIVGTGRITVFIKPDFFKGTFISLIIRNENFGKMKVIV